MFRCSALLYHYVGAKIGYSVKRPSVPSAKLIEATTSMPIVPFISLCDRSNALDRRERRDADQKSLTTAAFSQFPEPLVRIVTI